MSVTLPATRVPKKLWKYLERLQEQKMFASTTELIREALREYVINHKNEIGEIEFEIIDSQFVLQKRHEEDRKKEEHLLEWTKTVRS